MEAIDLELEHQHLILDAGKAIYWMDESMLILSDLHLGKAGHFRKHGIAVPGDIHSKDLQKLDYLINRYKPKKITFLGDLFHSDLNVEWDFFEAWLENQSSEIILVKGNHDILPDKVYQSTRMHLFDDLIMRPFHFTHEKKDSAYYNISGHVHPAVRLKGKAKQGLTVPCFYFSRGFGLLPAYGSFTGTYKIRPKVGDLVFATTGDQVIALMP